MKTLPIWMILAIGIVVGLLLKVGFDAFGQYRLVAVQQPTTMAEIISTVQTTGRFLRRYQELRASNAATENKAREQARFALVHAIYIKAKSYALLNKVFFWMAVPMAVLVLIVRLQTNGTDVWFC